jgi:catechol 2,3-dioxygenase-like lactoylglutathione lyase family enzyme
LKTIRWGLIVIVGILTLTQTATAQDSLTAWVSGVRAPHYFAVRVADAEKSAAWYRLALGLRELDRSQAADGSWQIVNLTNAELFVEIIRDNRVSSSDAARGFAKVGFHVADVDVVAAKVGRATGTSPRVVEFAPHGVRIVQLRDPDGNIIQLFSPLALRR